MKLNAKVLEVVVLAVLGATACGKSDASAASNEAAAQALAATGTASTASTASTAADDAVARVHPCTLLTKDEIVAQVEASREPHQLEALHRDGVVWDVTGNETPSGAARVCEFAWHGTAKGEVMSKGEFTVNVTTAGWLQGTLGAIQNPKPIPGLGDEAYFVLNAPYARVGVIAVGIENFPDTRENKAGLALLRLAVPRLP